MIQGTTAALLCGHYACSSLQSTFLVAVFMCYNSKRRW